MTATTIGFAVGFVGGAVAFLSVAIEAGDRAVRLAAVTAAVLSAAFAAYHVALCLGMAA